MPLSRSEGIVRQCHCLSGLSTSLALHAASWSFLRSWLRSRPPSGARIGARSSSVRSVSGRDRRPFIILKFRSMRDGRVTHVGRFTRATGLDELPQFINILRGEMSAVGPRPLTAEDVRRLGWTSAEHDFRWRSRPGLTGLAQMACEGTTRAALELDRAYLECRSLRLDCQLIALSFAVNALGKARVRAFKILPRIIPKVPSFEEGSRAVRRGGRSV
jgi:hypothetical protein